MTSSLISQLFHHHQSPRVTMSDESGSPTFIIADFSDDDAANENWPEIEFRSPEDEAWYGVDVWELCDSLVVTFNGFSFEYDEVYSPEDFKNSDELKEFEERFRACSVQMQDTECATLAQGTKVCATCPSVAGEVKFYDAIVVNVRNAQILKSRFSVEKNFEMILRFVFFWCRCRGRSMVWTRKGTKCVDAITNFTGTKVLSLTRLRLQKLVTFVLFRKINE